MSYQKYILQRYPYLNYYTLLALPKTATLIDIKKQILKLRRTIKPPPNNIDSFYLTQWTDLIKITDTFKNSKTKKKYEEVHHMSFYSLNKDLYVKYSNF